MKCSICADEEANYKCPICGAKLCLKCGKAHSDFFFNVKLELIKEKKEEIKKQNGTH